MTPAPRFLSLPSPPVRGGVQRGVFLCKTRVQRGLGGFWGFLQTVMLPPGTGGIFGGSEGINFGVQRGLGGESPPTREGVPENTNLVCAVFFNKKNQPANIIQNVVRTSF